MGGGSWTSKAYTDYSFKKGRSLDNRGVVTNSLSAQEMFTSRGIDEALNPYNVVRECVDSEEHPNTKPVILALDVTGSMGSAAMEVAKKLNVVMTQLLDKVKDIEFQIMAIGDLSYDDAPIQVSQFESDIRIAEQLDKIYFEGCGGGNNFESYTAAWYMGSRHAKLDCWKRGVKGVIITMGDELLNPYLPARGLKEATGDVLQGDVETSDLYLEASEKFNIYHLDVDHGRNYLRSEDRIRKSYEKYLGKNFREVSVDNIVNTIIDIILDEFGDGKVSTQINETEDKTGMISW